uniref:DUF418 domain-containing protein n=1 Tax=Altererythrobacter segetis TaxID=1104773 RepID=UPI00140A0F8B|nr:DUF418 domain-containing protein [Altererythrobacter segetis]
MATTNGDRILTLDLIRGFAVMGILSVNIVGMAMIEDAYFYPPAYGFHSDGDKLMWALNSIFVDGRFRALFSMLFGASLTLVVTRAVEAGKKGWQVHYPRMIALLLFGCIHYYVLWWGDILMNYALVGMIAYLFWRLRPSLLVLAAIVALGLSYVPPVIFGLTQIHKIAEGMQPGAPPALQAKAKRAFAQITPAPAEIERDKREHDSLAAHIRASTQGETALEPWTSVYGYGIETLGLMLLGIALFKSGFLTGDWTRRSYVIVAATCLGGDLLIQAYAAYVSVKSNFDPFTFMPWTRIYLNPLHAIGAIGYAALIMLVFSQRSAVADRFAAVGRAAFTNYLGSTIIGTLLFYGTFGGLYGQLSRGQVWLFVPVIWGVMLLWSKPWLDRYNYGPFEWAWRSLARWKLQPMRKGSRSPVLAEA